MAYRPFLIPGYSGVHAIEKNTCVILIDSIHASLLEGFARPSRMIGYGCEITKEHGQYLSSIAIENRPDAPIDAENLISFAIGVSEDYNVILHVDDEAILQALLHSNLYDRLAYCICITTGAQSPVSIENYKTVLGFDQEPLAETKVHLPEIGGRRLQCSNAEFERRCLVHLAREERKLEPDNGLIALLGDAVRLAREYTDMMQPR